MFKYVCFGGIFTLVALINGLYTSEWEFPFKLAGVAALIPILGVAVFTGAFSRGERVNVDSDVKSDRIRKDNWTKKLLLMSAPNAVFIIVMLIVSIMI
ncbi:DUF5316 family protein [Thalassobacillus sp. CUG 92003]|uniref:DUF5316 family protein n=1 Tax=Thalassobacillus sp. CUG 92003 TaxID=2736641 RepID=UPI0015E6868B|nr:DUF5316 family protein [Thalassobacillus sp. CUG 92003]